MVTNAPFLTETTFVHKGTKTCLTIFISHFDECNKTISVCSSETHKKGIFFSVIMEPTSLVVVVGKVRP